MPRYRSRSRSTKSGVNPNDPTHSSTCAASSTPTTASEHIYRDAVPAMLVKTSLNDSQVMYWEPAKYVAKLRTLKTNETPLLLHVNMDAAAVEHPDVTTI